MNIRDLLAAAVPLLLTSSVAFAQPRTQAFELIPPKEKTESSIYNKISLIDQRLDTTNVGFIQKGLLNELVVLVTDKPMRTQVKEWFDAAIPAGAGTGELLLLLRKFKLIEQTDASTETGKFVFRATLFSGENDQYFKIAQIDTTVQFNAMEVSKKLLRRTNQVFEEFMYSAITKAPEISGLSYSLNEIRLLDSFEKLKIPLYNTTTYPDGFYASWASLSNLKPDYPVVAKVKDDGIFAIKQINSKGKPVNPRTKPYAVVWEGQIYIRGSYGFERLRKVGNNFIYTGKVASSAKGNDVAVGAILGGAIGGAIAAGNSTEVLDLMIDHMNGKHMKLNEFAND